MSRLEQKTFEFQNQPDLQIDQKVWVVLGPNNVKETQVRMFECSILPGPDDKKLVLILRKVTVFACSFGCRYYDDEPGESSFNRWRLFDTEDEANKMAEFLPIELSPEEWNTSIGDRKAPEDSEYNLEECELASCCANISEIRDMFLRCKKHGGLIRLDTMYLGQLFLTHSKPENSPILDGIIKKLELEWDSWD